MCSQSRFAAPQREGVASLTNALHFALPMNTPNHTHTNTFNDNSNIDSKSHSYSNNSIGNNSNIDNTAGSGGFKASEGSRQGPSSGHVKTWFE